ncbi:MAG: hypothetical protein ACRDJJ_07505 [Actinomycetota bacterium]
MAALSYVLPPLSGLVAYLRGRNARVRAHGLQAVIFGALWPAALYTGSALSAATTRGVFAVGVVTWAGLVIATALGRDPLLPGLARLAADPPMARDER